ncbi:MAG: ABC transporter permease [Alphaproteobacteria bacterium]|nr:ABC transporter permease [Alphaproteobacteria bacterium]MCA0451239.1 ABC transporter permease [Pseudomonadota bacterium]
MAGVTQASAPASEGTAKVETPFRRFVADFTESKLALGGLIVFAIVFVAAMLCAFISPQNPYDLRQLDIMDGKMPPGSVSGDGLTFLLGSDSQGRDMVSAILYGLRTSFLVAVTSGFIAAAVGTTVGLIAAYYGGKIDTFLMRTVDIKLSFPAILIALILLALLGQGTGKIILALVIIQWAYYARTVRASALVERRKEYVEAAHCLALPKSRILFRHILPNCLPPLIVVATIQIANSIALEATLSFLGVGLPITEPSLGLLIANGFEYILSGVYWISFFPGIALLVTIVSINLVGDQLRDVLNPRLQK